MLSSKARTPVGGHGCQRAITYHKIDNEKIEPINYKHKHETKKNGTP